MSWSQKIPVLLAFCLIACHSLHLSNNYAVSIAQIDLNLGNLKYDFGNGNYIRFFDGRAVEIVGPFVSATVYSRVVNGDFNGDGYADAAVNIQVVYTGIGYFDQFVFVVLQDYVNGPTPTNGISIGNGAVYNLDVFSANPEVNRIIVGFVDRLPGQPKAVAPSVPTIWKLKVDNKVLQVESKKTLDKTCNPF